MNKIIKSIKIEGETYKFINKGDYIICETPENCFGYTDAIFINRLSSVQQQINLNRDGVTDLYSVYTLHRYLAPWKLEKIKKHFVKLYEKEGLTIWL